MKKNLITVTILALLLVGCKSKDVVSQSSEGVESEVVDTVLPPIKDVESEATDIGKDSASTMIQFANLADEESRADLQNILVSSEFSEETINYYFELVDDFNSRVEDKGTLVTEYMSLENLDYSNVFLDPANMYETNCRLATFALTRDYINAPDAREYNDTYLMFDKEVLKTEPLYQTTEENIQKFMNYFGTVDISGLTTMEEHIDKIRGHLENSGVTINLDENISIINIYLHSSYDNLRFVGHTGVLFKVENGYVFVEKYGPYAPFQMTKFTNKFEVWDYIMTRKDLSSYDDELEPIIFENLEVVEKQSEI